MLYSEVTRTHCLCCAKSLQSSLTLCNPMDYSPQVPLSLEFSRQGYWHGLPCPPPGDLPNSGIKPMSPVTPVLQANSLPLSHWGSPQLEVIVKSFTTEKLLKLKRKRKKCESLGQSILLWGKITNFNVG